MPVGPIALSLLRHSAPWWEYVVEKVTLLKVDIKIGMNWSPKFPQGTLLRRPTSSR